MDKIDKKLINQALNLCGHLLPMHQRVNNYTFAGLIKDNYSLMNPIANKIYKEVREAKELYYTRSEDNIRVVKI